VYSLVTAGRPMRVLIADDDPLFAKVLESLATRAGHECTVVGDGDCAWEIVSGQDPPRIVFLDWMMPGIDGLELCRRIRELERSNYIYIVIVSARTKQRDITLGYQAGADDFITKPFQVQEMLSRLRVAERVVHLLSPGVTLKQALEEACQGNGGDIIVRSGPVVGRIMTFHGEVAWAHVSNEPGSLYAMLESVQSVTKEDVHAVLEECSATGQNFAPVLVDWGLIGADALRERMRTWIRDKIASIGRLTAPTIIFSPEKRTYSDGFLFDIAEVIAPEFLAVGSALGGEAVAEDAKLESPRELAAVTSVVDLSSEDKARCDAILDCAIAIHGAVSVTLFDGRTGGALGTRGADMNLDFAWQNLKLVAAADTWDAVEDVIITTKHHLHILRQYSIEPARFIFLTTDRADVRLGMIRLSLADCTA